VIEIVRKGKRVKTILVVGEGCVQYLGGQEPKKERNSGCYWCVTDGKCR